MSSIQTTNAFRTKSSTISSTAVAISAAGWSWATGDLAAAEKAIISAHTQGIVVTWDGTTPTATLGRAVAAGETLTIVGNENVQNIKMIRSGGSDATVSVTLEKYGV